MNSPRPRTAVLRNKSLSSRSSRASATSCTAWRLTVVSKHRCPVLRKCNTGRTYSGSKSKNISWRVTAHVQRFHPTSRHAPETHHLGTRKMSKAHQGTPQESQCMHPKGRKLNERILPEGRTHNESTEKDSTSPACLRFLTSRYRKESLQRSDSR